MLDAPLRQQLGSAMTLAQSGRESEALVLLKTVLADQGEEPSYALAAAEYVRAIAAQGFGDVDESLRAVASCVAIARAIGEPGWESNALSVGVVSDARRHGAGSIDDLVRAEQTLSATSDPGLQAWGHTGLGYAYLVLRLFELAIPHLEQALGVHDDVLDIPESKLIDWLNLGEAYLRWAEELQQLGDPSLATEIQAHEDSAYRAATTALTLYQRGVVDAGWSRRCRVLQLAARWRRATAEEIELTDRTWDDDTSDVVHQDQVVLGAYLARMRVRNGQLETAKQTIDSVIASLSSARVDPQVDTFARGVALEVAAAAGEPAALTGLAYAQSITSRWWQERLRVVETVREAHRGGDLARRHENERRAAREDPLTGVSNRRGLSEWLAERDASGGEAALISVDLDGFKALNDEFGHVCGDEVLCAVAELATSVAAPGDLVARIGGDEFVVALADAAPEEVSARLHRLRAGAEEYVATATAAHLRTLELSLGSASSLEGHDQDALLAVADSRMYADKRRHSRWAGA